jgi:hypothetical protein
MPIKPINGEKYVTMAPTLTKNIKRYLNARIIVGKKGRNPLVSVLILTAVFAQVLKDQTTLKTKNQNVRL